MIYLFVILALLVVVFLLLRAVKIHWRTAPSPRAHREIGGYIPTSGVTFEAWWEHTVVPDTWSSVWASLCDEALGRAGLTAELKRRMSGQTYESAGTKTEIARGAEITVIPIMEGATFNPPMARFHWLEAWHLLEFRMKVAPAKASTLPARIEFYVGVVLVAEVAYVVRLAEEKSSSPARRSSISPYRSIFVSYSAEDEAIVRQLEKAFRSIGDSYLRDIHVLRSGQEWNRTLLDTIETADIFQLCWSHSAKRSKYVEQEWRHAHGLQRAGFIRPMYWERPMPEPPEELAHLHFSYMPID